VKYVKLPTKIKSKDWLEPDVQEALSTRQMRGETFEVEKIRPLFTKGLEALKEMGNSALAKPDDAS
jgi:hypothetical protein